MRKNKLKFIVICISIITIIVNFQRYGLSVKIQSTNNSYDQISSILGNDFKSVLENIPSYFCASCPSVVKGDYVTKFNKNSSEAIRRLMNATSGGMWTPTNCKPVHEPIALIYAWSPLYLQNTIPRIHSLLRLQNIPHLILVIKQINSNDINKGRMFNAGFSLTPDWIKCIFLADEDIIPKRFENMFVCNQTLPKHLISGLSQLGYKLPYQNYFGGILGFTRTQFESVNGFRIIENSKDKCKDYDIYQRTIDIFEQFERVDELSGDVLNVHLEGDRKSNCENVTVNMSSSDLKTVKDECELVNLKRYSFYTLIEVDCIY